MGMEQLRRPQGAEAAQAMAALLALGGMAGFAARRSKPSLIAGLVLGSSFGASGYAIGASCRVRSCFVCSVRAAKLPAPGSDDGAHARSVRFTGSVAARSRFRACALDADSCGHGQTRAVEPPAGEDIRGRIGWSHHDGVLVSFSTAASCLRKSTKCCLDARRVSRSHEVLVFYSSRSTER